ncbi:MAG TPA: hypothetical protein VIR98_00690 [Candidatus Paceibacterota bacterium]
MKIYITIVVLILLIAGITYAYRTHEPETQGIPPGVVCTMDAKLCPDGSYVGRQGPNCEFAQCPGTSSSSGTHASGTIDFEGNVQ